MYSFIDVTELSEGAVLPSEALSINGQYIEDVIPGYRTLTVKGREALSPELESIETGVRDGARLKSKRYPTRVITVKYQLIAATAGEFREAYNKLGGLLNVEDAQLIFNDEPDKFFTGTPADIGEVSPGMNSITAEFNILCADPFKYSIAEYEATPADGENAIMLNYNGTYKAYPTLEADFYSERDVADDGETAGTLTGGGDCGYVAFFTEDEKIIQLGDPEELDGETAYAKSQTLANQTFKTSTAWGTTAKKLWAVNAGTIFPDVTDAEQVGGVGMAAASYATPAGGAATSGALLDAWSDQDQPKMHYKVNAKTSGRTSTSVKVTVTVTAALQYSGSYFGRGYGLVAAVYMGGAWHSATLKGTSEYWSGQTAHTINITFTVSGLSAATASLTGIQFRVTRSDSLGGGESACALTAKACKNLAISPYTAETAATQYLTCTNFGTSSAKWHGASITRAFGADAAGVVGATDFTFTYRQKMCIGNTSGATSQKGDFYVTLFTEDKTVIAGVRIVKYQTGKTASLRLYVGGNRVKMVDIDLSYNNKYFGSSSKSIQNSTIRKSGATVYFNIGGYTFSYTSDAIKDLAVTNCTFMFARRDGMPALAYNGLYSAKFVKNNCDTWRDIPNKFSANDVVIADCRNCAISLNGTPAPDLGALGNDWEGFYLTPGFNSIGFAFSDWVTAGCEPSFKIRWREVYL